jgi:predicted nucleic acid-binding protein
LWVSSPPTCEKGHRFDPKPAGEDRPEIVEVIARAGELVREHTLRAYDAIHLATALREEASELLAQREPAEESPQ